MARKPELPQWVKDNLRAWTIHLRAKHGGTQGEFAAFVGTTQPVISKLESRGEAGLDVLIKLSTACGEKIDDLIRFRPRDRVMPGTNHDPGSASPASPSAGRQGSGGD